MQRLPAGALAAPLRAGYPRPVHLPPSGGSVMQGQSRSVGSEVNSRSGSRLSAGRLGRFPPRWIVASQAGLAFPLCRLPLPLGALFGSEPTASGRVDALVAVVPADPIARRRIASQHLLHDTRAGPAGGRLGLGYDALADLKRHADSHLVRASDNSRRWSFATTAGAGFHRPSVA